MTQPEKRRKKHITLPKRQIDLAKAWERGFAAACLEDSGKTPQNPYTKSVPE